MNKVFEGQTVPNKQLETIIDINSYVEIDSSYYSKDRRHVYYFQPTSDGGVRKIVDGADHITFKRLCEYRWGIDRQQVFYMGEMLTGINPATLQVLYPPDTTDPFVQYVKDDKLVYYNNWIIPTADAKTFTVVSGKSWEAEDRNNTYEATSPHPKPRK